MESSSSFFLFFFLFLSSFLFLIVSCWTTKDVRQQRTAKTKGLTLADDWLPEHCSIQGTLSQHDQPVLANGVFFFLRLFFFFFSFLFLSVSWWTTKDRREQRTAKTKSSSVSVAVDEVNSHWYRMNVFSQILSKVWSLSHGGKAPFS